MTSDSTHSHPPSAHSTTLTYTYCQIPSHTGDESISNADRSKEEEALGGEGDQSITGNGD